MCNNKPVIINGTNQPGWEISLNLLTFWKISASLCYKNSFSLENGLATPGHTNLQETKVFTPPGKSGGSIPGWGIPGILNCKVTLTPTHT